MASDSPWLPSPARTVRLPVPRVATASPAYCGGLKLSAMSAGDSLDYGLDCTDWLVDAADTIAALAVRVIAVNGAPGPAVAWATWYGPVIALWIEGGSPGVIQPVDVSFRTALGRVATVRLDLPVGPATSLIAPGGPPSPPGQMALPGQVVISNGTDAALLPPDPSATATLASDPALTVAGIAAGDLAVLMRRNADGSYTTHNILWADALAGAGGGSGGGGAIDSQGRLVLNGRAVMHVDDAGRLVLDIPLADTDPTQGGAVWTTGGFLMLSKEATP